MAETLTRLIDIPGFITDGDEAQEARSALNEIFSETMNYVVSGAELTCNLGGEGKLFIEEDDNAQLLTGKPMAQKHHGVANENILMEGKCRSIMHPEARSKSINDCTVEISSPLWLLCKENALIGEKPALMKEESIIICDYGGVISINSNGQKDYDDTIREEILLQAIENTLKKLLDPSLELSNYVVDGEILNIFYQIINKNVFTIIEKLIIGAGKKEFQVDLTAINNAVVPNCQGYLPSIYVLMTIAGYEEIETQFYYATKSEKAKKQVTFGVGSMSNSAESLAEKLIKYGMMTDVRRILLQYYIGKSDTYTTDDVISALGIDVNQVIVKPSEDPGTKDIIRKSVATLLYMEDVAGHIPTEMLTLLGQNNISLTQSQIDALFSMHFNGDFIYESESPELTKALLSEDFDKAYVEITERSNAEKLEGLDKRRESEGDIFKSGHYSDSNLF